MLRPKVGINGLKEIADKTTGEELTVTPTRVASLAARGRRRFRKEQISASKVNTNGLTCPTGALDR